MTITLLYHDVIADRDNYDSSGFLGADANLYKLDAAAFAAHLALVESQNPNGKTPEVLFTFDDGGISAFTTIAPMLEAAGRRGVFFVCTAHIGAPGFLTKSHIRELHDRGHAIGAHSHSHPFQIHRLPVAAITEEWRRCCSGLESIVGKPIDIASVPGGYYSEAVAHAAAVVNIRTLFTSQPTSRDKRVASVLVKGRYAVTRQTSSQSLRLTVAADPVTQARQTLWWNSKKAVKALGGAKWLALRKSYFEWRRGCE